MTTQTQDSTDLEARATRIIAHYTVLASGTGAIPLPAASTAVVVEDSAMVVHIAALYGVRVSLGTILTSIGPMGLINVAGKTLFVECARALSWGAGSPWAAVLVSGIGATTAGVQTYIVGRIAVAVAENGGHPLPESTARTIVAHAKSTYREFLEYWREREPAAP